jgi:hypothetical protein
VQEQRDFVQQPFRGTGALDDDRARILLQLGFLGAREAASRIDDYRREGGDLLAAHALQQFPALHVRQLQVDDHAVENVRVQQLERFFAAGHGLDIDVLIGDQLHHAFALAVIVFHQQDVLDIFCVNFCSSRAKTAFSSSRVMGFFA